MGVQSRRRFLATDTKKETLAFLAEEEKYARGLIGEARYTAARGIIEFAHDVETARFFNEISRSRHAAGEFKHMPMASETPLHASWEKLPNETRYLSLRGAVRCSRAPQLPDQGR